MLVHRFAHASVLRERDCGARNLKRRIIARACAERVVHRIASRVIRHQRDQRAAE